MRARLSVAGADGGGRVARRDDALLWVTGGRWDAWPAALQRFADEPLTGRAVADVLDGVVAARFDVDPFVLVRWDVPPTAIVLGDAELVSTLPTMGTLGGRGSQGWVEHRFAVPADGCRLLSGAAPRTAGWHERGLADADGFVLDLTPSVDGPPSSPPPPPHDTPPVRVPTVDPFDPEITLTAEQVERPPSIGAQVEDLAPEAPGLGWLLLPDGRRVEIRGTLVLGRRPDASAARIDGDATLCPLVVGNDVSRTHLVVRVAGRTIEAIDCASSGQTVLLASGPAEPVLLQPWVPHEVSDGDTLYLGGPTTVRIER